MNIHPGLWREKEDTAVLGNEDFNQTHRYQGARIATGVMLLEQGSHRRDLQKQRQRNRKEETPQIQ